MTFLRHGRKRIPVGKIVCLGKNYAKHAREMGGEAPKVPVIFLKPATSIIHDGGTIRLPRSSKRVDHEVELGVVIATRAEAIKASSWRKHVSGYVLLIDVTARDLQDAAKKAGEPWTVSKGFDTFCPVSSFIPARKVADPHALRLRLAVNETVKQDGWTGDMTLRIPETIELVSSIMTLEPGDVIATGTPDGVGPLQRGDEVDASLGDLARLRVVVAD